MGRPKAISIHQRAQDFKKDGIFVCGHDVLMCKYYDCRLEWVKKDSLQKHVVSNGHVNKKEKAIKLAESNPNYCGTRQETLAATFSKQSKVQVEKAEFISDTVKMMLRTNIPMEKLDHPALREYMKKYIPGSGDLPCADTLRRNHAKKTCEQMKTEIREQLEDKPIVIIADETTDKNGRCVLAILFRTLTGTAKQEVFLADISFLTTANGTSCCQAIIDTLKAYDIKYENVLGLVCDSARYMETCYQHLAGLCGPQVMLFQCWAHKFNLVGDLFMKELQELNALTTKLKMAFLHSRKMKSAYINFLKENYPQLTRWNSWFRAVKYVDLYIEPLEKFLNSWEGANTSTQNVVKIFSNNKKAQVVNVQTKFVSETCTKFIEVITNLEGSNYPYGHRLWDDIECLQGTLKRVSSGNFLTETTKKIAAITDATLRADIVSSLKSASTLALTKLNKHAAPGHKTNSIMKVIGQIFNPCLAVVMPQDVLAADKCKKIPYFENVSLNECNDGYQHFNKLLRAALEDSEGNNHPDVVSLLLACKIKFPAFATAALQAIWTPVNSVDAERFFSSYNMVLTDRRRGLKEDSIVTCSMLMFNYQ